MAGLSEQEEFELLSLEREKSFKSTPGGAAVGNPNLQAQSDKAVARGLSPTGERILDIGGAGAIGGLMGAAAPELLSGAAGVARSFPATAGMAPALQFMSGAARNAGRLTSAASGAIAGLTGESAGQAVEAAGGPQLAAEGARLVAGGIGPEIAKWTAQAGKWVLQAPALSVEKKVVKETIKAALAKISGTPDDLPAQERKYVEGLISDLRGGPKSDAPLERVGSIMGEQGGRLLGQSEQMMIAAIREGESVGKPGAFGGAENADIGSRLRDAITSRQKLALDARSKQYANTERVRDMNVEFKENSGNTIDKTQEFTDLLNSVRAELVGGQRSPSVQSGFQKILTDIENRNDVGEVSFKSLDDVRRKLGDAFRGKPAEGYESIGATNAKDLYKQISELQKKYAGPAQEKLLEDYHNATEGMQVFSSKLGKKATALDQYRAEQYATDPSSLPGTYFKTRASVQALKELTGSNKTVAIAALEHADKELAGKNAQQVRDWMTKNGEWLSEVRPVQGLVDKYATRLEAAERSMLNAQDFAKQAAADNKLLTRKSLPAQRAIDLIQNGDTEIWGKVAPAIMASPQAKQQLVMAARQVLGDQATAKGTQDFYARNLRPFLEMTGSANKVELDGIAASLSKIRDMQMPEPEKLGVMKRILLNSIGGYVGGGIARGDVKAYNELATQVVPK